MLRNYMKLANNDDEQDPFADDLPDVEQEKLEQPVPIAKPNQPEKVEQKPFGKRPLNVVGTETISQRPYLIVELPDLTRGEFKQLEKIADNFIDSKTEKNKIPRWGTDDRGKKNVAGILRRRTPNENVIMIQSNLGVLITLVFERLNALKFDLSHVTNYLNVAQQQQQQAAAQKPVTLFLGVLDEFRTPMYNRFIDEDVIGIRLQQSDGTPCSKEMRDVLSKIIDKNAQRSAYLEPGTFKFDGTEGAFIFHKVDINALERISSACKENKIDTEFFDNRIVKYRRFVETNKKPAKDFRKIVRAENVSSTTKFWMRIEYPEHADLQNELSSYIKFSFPTYGNLTHDMKLPKERVAGEIIAENIPEGMLVNDIDAGIFYIYGSYDDLYKFGALLNKTGWDVTEYARVFAELTRAKLLQPELFRGNVRYTGALDGYEDVEPITDDEGNRIWVQNLDEDGNPIYLYESFYKDIDKVTQEDVKLFDEQKNGVRWLYERNSAILGDDPGTGKTLTTLTAAAMRVMDVHEGSKEAVNGKVLIVTMNNLKFQWAAEIQNKFGVDPKKIIICSQEKQKGLADIPYTVSDALSMDKAKDAQWFIISYSNIGQYPRYKQGTVEFFKDPDGNFSFDKPRIKSIYDTLKRMDFAVVLIDESHNVKNPETAAATVLSDIVSKIPFKWAASATTIANTPADIHNILRLTGHPLGQMSLTRFKKAYVGKKIKTSDINKADYDEKVDDMLRKSFELKKVLVLSNIFLSRSMRDINPELPKHDVDTFKLPYDKFNMQEFEQNFADVIHGNGGANAAALGAMIKARVELARMKTTETVNFAKKILKSKQGHKVLIFSNFIPCVNKIASDLDAFLKSPEIDPYFDPEHEANYPTERVLKISQNDEGPNIQNKVQAFKNPDNPTRVMVISAKKGGTGLSLENTAQYVIMNDFDWSPSTAKQTEGRAFRINNIAPVKTYYMVIGKKDNRVSLDETFYIYVKKKIEIAEHIQRLDQETQRIILAGLNGAPERRALAELQKQHRELLQQNAEIEQQLNAEVKEFAAEHGADPDYINFDGDAARILEEVEEAAELEGKDVDELDLQDLERIIQKIQHDQEVELPQDLQKDIENQDEQDGQDEDQPKQASWYGKAKFSI